MYFVRKKYYNQSYKCGFLLIPQSVQEQCIHSKFGKSKIHTNVDFNSSNNNMKVLVLKMLCRYLFLLIIIQKKANGAIAGLYRHKRKEIL